MDQMGQQPCQANPSWIQLFIAVVGSITTVLTTWLALRAASKDRAEMQRKRLDREQSDA